MGRCDEAAKRLAYRSSARMVADDETSKNLRSCGVRCDGGFEFGDVDGEGGVA